MTKTLRYTGLALALLASLNSCKHDVVLQEVVEENPDGGGNPDPDPDPDPDPNPDPEFPCSPDTVYFKSDILPLMVSSCAMPGCHDAITAEEDIILDSYENIMNPGEYRTVIPGRPDRSSLYTSLFPEYAGYEDDDIMPPPPYSPLNDEQKALIKKWIEQGALNNFCEDSECLTDGLSYTSHIKDLVDKHCTGCHSTVNPLGDVILETYDQVKTSIDSEAFMHTVYYDEGYSPMPPGYRLSDCEVDQLEQWITDGMPRE